MEGKYVLQHYRVYKDICMHINPFTLPLITYHRILCVVMQNLLENKLHTFENNLLCSYYCIDTNEVK